MKEVEHMTQKCKKDTEFHSVFLSLDDKGQDSALAILKTLEFAQSIMCSPKDDEKDSKPFRT